MVACDQVATIPSFKEFDVKDKLKFLVINFHKKFDGLIGTDILEKYNSEISLRNKKVIINSKPLQLFFDTDQEKELDEYEKFINNLNLENDMEVEKVRFGFNLNTEEREQLNNS